jgi:tight adherence protein B
MMVVINFINPGYSKILFEDPFGRKLLYIGAGLLTIGMLTIRHLINKIEV